jgi:hypothetical protein
MIFNPAHPGEVLNVDIQYQGKKSSDEIIVDPDLSKKLRPKILLGGEVVEHFVPKTRHTVRLECATFAAKKSRSK